MDQCWTILDQYWTILDQYLALFWKWTNIGPILAQYWDIKGYIDDCFLPQRGMLLGIALTHRSLHSASVNCKRIARARRHRPRCLTVGARGGSLGGRTFGPAHPPWVNRSQTMHVHDPLRRVPLRVLPIPRPCRGRLGGRESSMCVT